MITSAAARKDVDWFDDSDQSVHRLVFPEQYTYTELDTVFSRLTGYYRRWDEKEAPTRFGLVVDLSRVKGSSVRNRARIAAALAVVSDVLERHCVGQAYVITKPIIRRALSALFSLKGPGGPVRIFGSRDEAERWLRLRLAGERS